MMRSTHVLALALGFSIGLAAGVHADQEAVPDVARGAAVFKRCVGCHSLRPSNNKGGPHLAGRIGKKAGSVDGFLYSEALKNSGLVWDVATLDSFLAAPAKKVPGTRMFFAVPDDRDRADLIAYLAAQE
jgi:cytochrome c